MDIVNWNVVWTAVIWNRQYYTDSYWVNGLWNGSTVGLWYEQSTIWGWSRSAILARLSTIAWQLFFSSSKTCFISFGHQDKSCFFFFCGIYTGVLCTCPLLQPMVLKGSNPVRLSAMVCQSLLQTIWRDVQQNVICHRFIPDEHVQAI